MFGPVRPMYSRGAEGQMESEEEVLRLVCFSPVWGSTTNQVSSFLPGKIHNTINESASPWSFSQIIVWTCYQGFTQQISMTFKLLVIFTNFNTELEITFFSKTKYPWETWNTYFKHWFHQKHYKHANMFDITRVEHPIRAPAGRRLDQFWNSEREFLQRRLI